MTQTDLISPSKTFKDKDHHQFLQQLESGALRAAIHHSGQWIVQPQVKSAILDLFRHTKMIDFDHGFCDKDALAPRQFTVAQGIRVVPGGSAVRPGTFLGQNVVVMPPSYINIGAYIGQDTMIDSHVLVGSCAQIGERVHVSAGVQIAGVLEPIGQCPVIIESDCFIGAGSILSEGVLIRTGAVIGASVTLTASIPIIDCVHQTTYYGEVPENAVVIAGSRNLNSAWAQAQGLKSHCALIVKYRDTKTDHQTALESALRQPMPS